MYHQKVRQTFKIVARLLPSRNHEVLLTHVRYYCPNPVSIKKSRAIRYNLATFALQVLIEA